tara:strand:+ start:14536 stop:14661 length:126 start_codon:yes stop_codon:yes gene_type:complete
MVIQATRQSFTELCFSGKIAVSVSQGKQTKSFLVIVGIIGV